MQWTTARINDLPDASFAYIAPGGKKDKDGKTAPRTLRMLPYKNADGKIDPAHLRNALARFNQAKIPATAKAGVLFKLRSAAKSLKEGGATCQGNGKKKKGAAMKEGLTVNGESVSTTREEIESALWEGLTVDTPRTIVCSEANFMDGATPPASPEDRIIKNVAVLHPSSKHNRSYSPESLKQAVKLFEGSKVRLDHPEPGTRYNKIRDLAGSLHGIYQDGAVIRAKELRAAGPGADVLLKAARECPNLCGLSIRARGIEESLPDGSSVVKKFVSVSSVDFVDDPASTTNLYEGQPADSMMSCMENPDDLGRVCNKVGDMVWQVRINDAMSAEEKLAKIEEIYRDAADVISGLAGESAVTEGLTVDSGLENGDKDMDLATLKIAELRESRPDLIADIVSDAEKRASAAETELKAIKTRQAARELAESVCNDAKVPAGLRTASIMEAMISAGDKPKMEALAKDLIEWAKVQSGTGPVSRESVNPAMLAGAASAARTDADVDGAVLAALS